MARSQICTDVLFLCLHLALSGFGSVRLCYFVSVCLSVCPTVSFSLSIYPHFLSLSLTLHHLSPTDTHQPVPDYPSVSIPAHPPSSFSLPLIHSFSLCLPPSIHLQLLSLVLGEDTPRHKDEDQKGHKNEHRSYKSIGLQGTRHKGLTLPSRR